MNRRVEQTRDGETDGVRYTGPTHDAPMTWHRCIAPGCDLRVDPWDHNTRCPEHRPEADHRGDAARNRRREVARAIVTANRECRDRASA